MTLTQTHKTALERFAETLDEKQVRRASKVRFQLPLLFDDFEQEVNFWALNSLLSFGSGWHQARAAVFGARCKTRSRTNNWSERSVLCGNGSRLSRGDKWTQT